MRHINKWPVIHMMNAIYSRVQKHWIQTRRKWLIPGVSEGISNEMKLVSCSVMSDPLQSHGQAPRSIVVLQARMLEWVAMPSSRGSSTQGLNPGLPHCRWILYHVSHQGSPGILEWVACPFSRVTSWPSNQTGVSCIAGGFFISLANREAPLKFWHLKKFFWT